MRQPRYSDEKLYALLLRESDLDKISAETGYSRLYLRKKISLFHGAGISFPLHPVARRAKNPVARKAKKASTEEKGMTTNLDTKSSVVETVDNFAAYAAGVFDACGTIEAFYRSDKSLAVRLRLTSTRQPVLAEIVKRYGGAISDLGGTSFLLAWHDNGEQEYAFLSAIAPHLRSLRQQAQPLVTYFEYKAYLQMQESEVIKAFDLERKNP